MGCEIITLQRIKQFLDITFGYKDPKDCFSTLFTYLFFKKGILNLKIMCVDSCFRKGCLRVNLRELERCNWLMIRKGNRGVI